MPGTPHPPGSPEHHRQPLLREGMGRVRGILASPAEPTPPWALPHDILAGLPGDSQGREGSYQVPFGKCGPRKPRGRGARSSPEPGRGPGADFRRLAEGRQESLRKQEGVLKAPQGTEGAPGVGVHTDCEKVMEDALSQRWFPRRHVPVPSPCSLRMLAHMKKGSFRMCLSHGSQDEISRGYSGGP